MLSDRLSISDQEVVAGRGLVTNTTIAAGDTLWKSESAYPLVSAAELMALKAQGCKDSYSQIDADLFARTEGDEYFWNHSCTPNCLLDNRSLVAMRDLQAGEEVTYDYGLTETDLMWFFWCDCGSPGCRRYVCNLDYLKSRYRYRSPWVLPSNAQRLARESSFASVLKYQLRTRLFRIRHTVFGTGPTPGWLKWATTRLSAFVR